MKRLFDIIVAGAGLLLLTPLFVGVAMLIKLDSPGPVFFKQKRIGRGFCPFWIYKFRTMRHDAPENMQLTVGADSRITRIVGFLRRS